MQTLDSTLFALPTLWILIAGLLATLLVLRVARRLVRRRRPAPRVVEKPNSHYASHLAQQSEARHRWHEIRLDRVHEINRAEVARLLPKADAAGADALNPREREFLDYMAELAGRPA